MESKSLHLEYLIRVIIVITVCVQMINSRGVTGTFILFLLVFLLNSQLRINLFKGKMLLLSIVIEFILVYFIFKQFQSITFLLLFITMTDSILLLETEGIFLSLVTLVYLAYLLNSNEKSISLYIGLYTGFFVIMFRIKKLRKKVSQIELLYDRNRRYSYELEEAKTRIEEYSKKVEDVSQLEERNRISREIHDTVGHKLTSVLMQLEATIKLFESNRENGMKMLYSVRDNMRNCVDILRQTVKSMRPKGYSSRILSIRKMVEDFKKDTGVDVTFNVTGTPAKLFPGAELTLYKNTQEAVTNAVRHGKADKISVEINYSLDKVVLTVSDNGIGCNNVIKGMGISGMEERVKLLGGKLLITSKNGFSVKTVIPVLE